MIKDWLSIIESYIYEVAFKIILYHTSIIHILFQISRWMLNYSINKINGPNQILLLYNLPIWPLKLLFAAKIWSNNLYELSIWPIRDQIFSICDISKENVKYVWNNIYFRLRFGLANAINNYQRLKILVVCVANF